MRNGNGRSGDVTCSSVAAVETLVHSEPWLKSTVKHIYRGIRRFKIKEIPFREDFLCHSTWKRCKHSGHFSRFRNIIGNFCIKYKTKMLCNYVFPTSSLKMTFPSLNLEMKVGVCITCEESKSLPSLVGKVKKKLIPI
jgi:hypothetical protein